MVLTIKQYNGEYMEEIRIFRGVQYTVNRRIFTTDTVEIQRVPREISLSADAFGCFKVNPDTTEIEVELKKPQQIGYLASTWVPYYAKDFMYYHKKDPTIYVLLTFIKGRIVFDYLYGYRKYLHKMPYSIHTKVEDTSKGCQIFYREDMPDEARQLCNYAPLDTINI